MPFLSLFSGIGQEDSFIGVVDLIENKSLIWDGNDKGVSVQIGDVPPNLKEIVNEQREVDRDSG